MKLCQICARLDIRKLLLLADEDGYEKYATLEEKLERAGTATAAHNFFLHQPSLDAVRINSSACDLCAAIWSDYVDYRTKPYTNPGAADTRWASSLTAPAIGNLGDGQIYITAAPRNTAKHGKSQIVAFRRGQNRSINILGWFDVYSEQPDQLDRADLLLRPIYSYAGSKECFALARKWLQICEEKHHLCKGQGRSLALPARLLELLPPTALGAETKVRLIDCHASIRRFAALSYSWGGESAQMLEDGTEAQFREVIPDAALPPTFRDAITVTRELGIQHLWIDALNIFQDSPDDFVRESSKMRDIYRGAVITIAGSRASKVSDSLLQQRDKPRWSCQLSWNLPQDDQIFIQLRPSEEYRETSLKLSPINSRGWCLQESLLAPRTLWLGSPVNVFECASGQVDEAGRIVEATERYRSKALISAIDSQQKKKRSVQWFRRIGLPTVVHLNIPKVVRDEWTARRQLQQSRKTFLTQGILNADGLRFTIYDHWRAIVQHYSERRLTRREDVLPALSGLAAHFSSVLGDRYLAGVWKADIIRSMCWRPVTRPGQELLESNFPNESYVAPSWSWASSSNVIVRFLPGLHNQRDEALVLSCKAKTVDCGTELASADPYGKINGGCLVLRGHFLPVEDPYKLGSLPFANEWSTLADVDEKTLAYEYKRNEFRVRHQHHANQEFALFHLCTMTESFGETPLINATLLLIETAGDGRSWRRVGFHTVRLGGTILLSGEVEQPLRGFKPAEWTCRDVRLI